MGFQTLKGSEHQFKILKIHILNKEKFSHKYKIYDAGSHTSYDFTCKNCNGSKTDINISDFTNFQADKIKINLDDLIEKGGTGSMCKLIKCERCNTFYYVGFGYDEPNNGRDVFMIHSILELKILDK